ncbi:MAG: hypothetical protein ABIJ57_00095 [Pseudomonadota bacterium]
MPKFRRLGRGLIWIELDGVVVVTRDVQRGVRALEKLILARRGQK